MQQKTVQEPSRKKAAWWVYTIPVLLLMLIAFHIVIYRRPGMLGLVTYYMGTLLVSTFAVIFLIIGIIQSAIRRPFFSKWRLIGFFGLLLFPLFMLLRISHGGTFFDAYPSSHTGERSKTTFRLPLDSPITVAWGGDDAATNYHVYAPDQRWAYDMLVTRNGKTFAGDSAKHESYFCYGLPVLAPAAGEIIEAFDSLENVAIGYLGETTHVGGNQVVIKVAEREYLFLCHLKPHSITVKKGDVVSRGQVLALVGNSGHTSEPHLHIHLQDSRENGFSEGVPLFFSNYSVSGKRVDIGMPTGGISDSGTFTGQIVKHLE